MYHQDIRCLNLKNVPTNLLKRYVLIVLIVHNLGYICGIHLGLELKCTQSDYLLATLTIIHGTVMYHQDVLCLSLKNVQNIVETVFINCHYCT